eukprot:15205077-Alexandrium_andersonii.AAC.1
MVVADHLKHAFQGGCASPRLHVDEVALPGARVHCALPAGRDGDMAKCSLRGGEEVDAVEVVMWHEATHLVIGMPLN